MKLKLITNPSTISLWCYCSCGKKYEVKEYNKLKAQNEIMKSALEYYRKEYDFEYNDDALMARQALNKCEELCK